MKRFVSHNGVVVPRDRQCCFWCAYLDHGGPFCTRHAPRPADTDDDGDGYVEWPIVQYDAWCGDFEEGSIEDKSKRKPKASDLEFGVLVDVPNKLEGQKFVNAHKFEQKQD